jgi:hypothetical protein
MKIKKVSKAGNELQKVELSAIKAGAYCVCDCDSPGCTDWVSQTVAISAAGSSWAIMQFPI